MSKTSLYKALHEIATEDDVPVMVETRRRIGEIEYTVSCTNREELRLQINGMVVAECQRNSNSKPAARRFATKYAQWYSQLVHSVSGQGEQGGIDGIVVACWINILRREAIVDRNHGQTQLIGKPCEVCVVRSITPDDEAACMVRHSVSSGPCVLT